MPFYGFSLPSRRIKREDVEDMMRPDGTPFMIDFKKKGESKTGRGCRRTNLSATFAELWQLKPEKSPGQVESSSGARKMRKEDPLCSRYCQRLEPAASGPAPGTATEDTRTLGILRIPSFGPEFMASETVPVTSEKEASLKDPASLFNSVSVWPGCNAIFDGTEEKECKSQDHARVFQSPATAADIRYSIAEGFFSSENSAKTSGTQSPVSSASWERRSSSTDPYDKKRNRRLTLMDELEAVGEILNETDTGEGSKLRRHINDDEENISHDGEMAPQALKDNTDSPGIVTTQGTRDDPTYPGLDVYRRHSFKEGYQPPSVTSSVYNDLPSDSTDALSHCTDFKKGISITRVHSPGSCSHIAIRGSHASSGHSNETVIVQPFNSTSEHHSTSSGDDADSYKPARSTKLSTTATPTKPSKMRSYASTDGLDGIHSRARKFRSSQDSGGSGGSSRPLLKKRSFCGSVHNSITRHIYRIKANRWVHKLLRGTRSRFRRVAGHGGKSGASVSKVTRSQSQEKMVGGRGDVRSCTM